MNVVNSDSLRIERIEMGPWGTNAYIMVCLRSNKSVVIDAPTDAGRILKSLEGTLPEYILITHGHGDHIGAVTELQSKLNIPVAIHSNDANNLSSKPEMLLKDGDIISFGEIKLEVLHTPGHTPGSLCFITGRFLISGDTIFPGGPGNTGSPDNFRQIVKSLTGKIFLLPDNTLIYPGHGEHTILKKEKDEFALFSSMPHNPNLCGDVLWLSS